MTSDLLHCIHELALGPAGGLTQSKPPAQRTFDFTSQELKPISSPWPVQHELIFKPGDLVVLSALLGLSKT